MLDCELRRLLLISILAALGDRIVVAELRVRAGIVHVVVAVGVAAGHQELLLVVGLVLRLTDLAYYVGDQGRVPRPSLA